MKGKYTAKHSRSGIDAKLPRIETFPNNYDRNYEIEYVNTEFTFVCPKTGLPDFGEITIHYVPRDLILELKSLKMYMLAYRNLGIFQENLVNRILDDIVKECNPRSVTVTGEFAPRGGLVSRIVAAYPADAGKS